MQFYKGCWLTIEIPSDRKLDENAMIKALGSELPGIHLRFVTKATVSQPTAAEAFVPETRHSSDAKKPLSAETILQTASNVLSNFAIDQRKAS